MNPPAPAEMAGGRAGGESATVTEAMLLRAVPERAWREHVVEMAALYGWRCYWTWNSKHSPKGFPDLVLVQPEQRRVLFVELKTERGRATREQMEWLLALHRAGQVAQIWRPRDRAAVVATLRGEAAVELTIERLEG